MSGATEATIATRPGAPLIRSHVLLGVRGMAIDWKTPKLLWDTLNAEFHFTLDACAEPWNAQCANYYTQEIDGLKSAWSGRVWCNPPFDEQRAKWVKKAAEESANGVTTVLLINANAMCDTEWWHRHALQASEIRSVRGRPIFTDVNGKETSMRVMLLIFRPTHRGKPVVTSVDRDGRPYA